VLLLFPFPIYIPILSHFLFPAFPVVPCTSKGKDTFTTKIACHVIGGTDSAITCQEQAKISKQLKLYWNFGWISAKATIVWSQNADSCMYPLFTLTMEDYGKRVTTFSNLCVVAVITTDCNIVSLANSHCQHQLPQCKFPHPWSHQTQTTTTGWQFRCNSDDILGDEVLKTAWQIPLQSHIIHISVCRLSNPIFRQF